MADTRECPLCGENMRVKERQTTDRVPGTSQVTIRRSYEWVCPECDYFEEADGPGDQTRGPGH
jgi:YgiT-type zinc finger domain-containing protein